MAATPWMIVWLWVRFSFIEALLQAGRRVTEYVYGVTSIYRYIYKHIYIYMCCSRRQTSVLLYWNRWHHADYVFSLPDMLTAIRICSDHGHPVKQKTVEHVNFVSFCWYHFVTPYYLAPRTLMYTNVARYQLPWYMVGATRIDWDNWGAADVKYTIIESHPLVVTVNLNRNGIFGTELLQYYP